MYNSTLSEHGNILLLEVKLTYDPVCPSVGWLVGRLICWPDSLS